ncbi:ribosome biogenesis protein NOP53-like [Rhopilema esculentum]|uniref:ribosome biogenesis protein NOP53-like n=1 Tax=Rhopilema esculentum TaxID=499914 RepID=UPI0031D76F9F
MADDYENVEKTVGKRKKGSMKNKRSWRKKTDIADVEDHLDDLRRQERTGGIVSEKPNEDLFFIEKDGKVENDNAAKTNRDKKVKDSNKLAQSSDEEEFVPKKVRILRKRAFKKEKERKLLEKMTKTTNDLWVMSAPVKENSWIDVTKKAPPKKPKTIGAKPSSLKPVQICHPGASYNPEYDDHQKILSRALEKEQAFLKNSEKLQNKLKFLTEEEFKKKPGWFQEMSEGLVPSKGSEATEDSQPGVEDIDILPKTVNPDDRKTRKQRRKELDRRKEDKLKEEERSRKLRSNDIYRLRSLKKELREDEGKRTEKQTLKRKLMLRKSIQPKRLGKLKYREPKIDFQLSEELSGSFRGLRPEGDPIIDRMKSFETRSLIEPRRKVIPHRKFKIKYVEKRSYKQPTVKDFIKAT